MRLVLCSYIDGRRYSRQPSFPVFTWLRCLSLFRIGYSVKVSELDCVTETLLHISGKWQAPATTGGTAAAGCEWDEELAMSQEDCQHAWGVLQANDSYRGDADIPGMTVNFEICV